jgi:LacI family gluconate utilization system Gnt-I transcriptional repressor
VAIPIVETWDLTDRPVDLVVGFSHVKVGGAVAGYFLAKGWQRVGVATADDRRATQRRDGFAAACGRDVPTATVPSPSSVPLGRKAMAQLLDRHPDLQAVYCSSDALAQGALIEAQSRGLRIPEDIALCGFGDADFAACLEPSLTTVRVDGAGMGRRAAQLILQRCEGESVAERIVDVGFSIVERASTVASAPRRFSQQRAR